MIHLHPDPSSGLPPAIPRYVPEAKTWGEVARAGKKSPLPYSGPLRALWALCFKARGLEFRLCPFCGDAGHVPQWL